MMKQCNVPSKAIFRVGWYFILLVSVYDAWLLLRFREVIVDTELNPLGVLLLHLCGGTVWLFLGLKLAGTVLVCTILSVLYQIAPLRGISITVVLACFQCALLVFLTKA